MLFQQVSNSKKYGRNYHFTFYKNRSLYNYGAWHVSPKDLLTFTLELMR